jgi:hypothetical protein
VYISKAHSPFYKPVYRPFRNPQSRTIVPPIYYTHTGVYGFFMEYSRTLKPVLNIFKRIKRFLALSLSPFSPYQAYLHRSFTFDTRAYQSLSDILIMIEDDQIALELPPTPEAVPVIIRAARSNKTTGGPGRPSPA